MKKSILTVLCMALFTVNAFAYSPAISVEVDDSADIFTFNDSISAGTQTLVGIGNQIEGTNWRMRNDEETPEGLKIHEGNAQTQAKYGINNSGDLFLDAVFESVQGYNMTVAKTIPSLVFTGDISELSADYQIKYEVRKNDNQTVTTGVRFMVHNGGKNYYALIFGGNNYNSGSATSGWQLVKSVDGAVTTLVQGGHLSYPGYLAMRNSVGNFWTVTITVVGNKIDFKAEQTENPSNKFGASYIDRDMFNVSGNDLGVWFMAMNGNNNAARNASFKNFSIGNYVPYLTASEPDNVMYIDVVTANCIDSDGIINLGVPMPVRKIVADSIANKNIDIYFSNDKQQWDKVSNAHFDSNGEWLNDKTAREYEYLAFDTDISGKISVLTETIHDRKFKIPFKTTVKLYPKAEAVTNPADYEWSVSRDDIAEVENGYVSLLRKGDVTINASYGEVEFECNISVIGDIENAIKNGTVNEYLDRVRPVFSEINRAISEDDIDGLKSVFLSSGNIKISDIADIDIQKIVDLSDDDFDDFIKRITTYCNFPCADIDDVYFLANTIDTEYYVGILNNIDGNSEFESELFARNYCLGLDLDNKYFKKYSDEVIDILDSVKLESVSDLRNNYVKAYVLTALKNALSPDMIEALIKDCENEIDYDQSHFNKNDCVDLYKEILEEKGSFTDLNRLKSFIDNYTKPKKDSDAPSGKKSGSGSSGGTMKMSVDADIVKTINDKAETNIVNDRLFADVDENHWAYESIFKLKNMNIINGYDDGYFHPNDEVTRAEFIKMITLAFNLDADAQDVEFSDVNANDWFYDAVMCGAKFGIVTGYPDGNFRPDAFITREEMTVMLYRVGRIQLNVDKDEFLNSQYKDSQFISDWAKEAISALTDAGILSGNYDMRFEPQRNATRAESVKSVSLLI